MLSVDLSKLIRYRGRTFVDRTLFSYFPLRPLRPLREAWSFIRSVGLCREAANSDKSLGTKAPFPGNGGLDLDNRRGGSATSLN
jgi:hypothetical protein